MKILHIINDLEIGGAQQLLADFLPLMKKQHDVEVLVLQGKVSPITQWIYDSGITIHCLNVKLLYNPMTILKIRRFLKIQQQYNIIHVHLFPSLYWVPLATVGMCNNLVWTEHSTSNRRKQKLLLRYTDRIAYSQYKKIICISQATFDSLKVRLGAQTCRRLCVIENGIDTNKFKNQRTMNRRPYKLIQVSRFEASKDQDTIIKAMSLLPSEIHLFLVGDGSRMKKCKALCNSLNLQDRVHFLGTKANIAQLLGKADIAIQSSHWEGFGLSAVEAMASGLPVVASDVDGLHQVVDGAGLLFPKGDEKSLAQLIEKIINSQTLYNELSEKSLLRAQQYEISNMTIKYLQVYEQISI